LKLLEHFPAVAVLGPKQAGKTTLVKEIRKQLTKDSIYLDLENPADSGALDHPFEFLNSVSDKTVIIDEIQRRPDIIPMLRSIIDAKRVNSRFILLGSASPQLLFLSNETLAGRIVYLELTTFEHAEIQHLTDVRNHWLYGGFPDPFILQDQDIRKEWFKSFISAYQSVT
jgi:predicted AAA+ superfamily ATPase